MDTSGFETLAEYPHSLVDSDGVAWVARARGRRRTDGLWEAFLAFEREDGAAVVRTSRETTQPNLTDALYWASGLTPVYLEGAFGRGRGRGGGGATEAPAAEHIVTASNIPYQLRRPAKPDGAGGSSSP